MAGHEKPETFLLEEASNWLLRLQHASCAPEDREDFERWLTRSPAHARAWGQICRAWDAMGERPALPDMAAPPPLPAPPPARAALKSRAGFMALAAGLLLAIALPLLIINTQADFSTGVAERRLVHLADGSTVELAAASAIDADFDAAGRHVRLLSGEAFFDVAHDAARPFTVTAGDVAVKVLGTRFDVRLTSVATTVELLHGAVDLSAGGQSMVLAPGETATFSHGAGALSRAAMDPADMAQWRGGRLFVNDVSVASVVEVLRRYHPAWIGVLDDDLARQRVTGLYDLTQPDRALAALVQPFGGRVRQVSPYLRLITK